MNEDNLRATLRQMTGALVHAILFNVEDFNSTDAEEFACEIMENWWPPDPPPKIPEPVSVRIQRELDEERKK